MESMLPSAPLREHETHCSMSDQHTNYSSCGRWADVKEEQRCPPSPLQSAEDLIEVPEMAAALSSKYLQPASSCPTQM